MTASFFFLLISHSFLRGRRFAVLRYVDTVWLCFCSYAAKALGQCRTVFLLWFDQARLTLRSCRVTIQASVQWCLLWNLHRRHWNALLQHTHTQTNYSWGHKFSYTLQNLQNVSNNKKNKKTIRRIIKIAFGFWFRPTLNKRFHITDVYM